MKISIRRCLAPIVLLGLFTLQETISAQSLPRLRLRLSPRLQQGLEAVYLADLDIPNKGTAEYLFDLDIYDVITDWDRTTLIIRLLYQDVPLVTLRSDPFYLYAPDPPPPAGMPCFSATNVDLITLETFPGSGLEIIFNTKDVNLPDPDYEHYVSGSGKLKRGSYYLQATLQNPAWNHEISAGLEIKVTNPSLIRLVTPADFSILRTEFPLFQFDSDGTEFTVYIYKRLSETDDIETVLSGHPTLEYFTDETRFNYQSTGGDPLENGSTYYWFVEALIRTSGGLEKARSPVWRFTLDTEGTSRPQENEQIRSLLIALLGQLGEKIFTQLIGYEVASVRVNGETISLAELQRILEDYLSRGFEIGDVTIQ